MAEPAAQRFEEKGSPEDISYGILIDELRATSSILEKDIERVTRLAIEARSVRTMARVAGFLTVSFIFFFGILVYNQFISHALIYDVFVGLTYFVVILGMGVIISLISLQEKRKSSPRDERAIFWRHIAAKLGLADELLARTAAWLDRARIPHVERSLIRLHFEHLSQLVDEAKEAMGKAW